MIIQTSANRFFEVTETGSADLAHVWNGIELKVVSGRKGAFALKKNGHTGLVRKAATRVITFSTLKNLTNKPLTADQVTAVRDVVSFKPRASLSDKPLTTNQMVAMFAAELD